MENRIKAIISDMFKVDLSLIKLDSGILKGDIDNWDSLGQLHLILKIEESVGIKFSMREIQEMKDLSSIISLLNKKMS